AFPAMDASANAAVDARSARNAVCLQRAVDMGAPIAYGTTAWDMPRVVGTPGAPANDEVTMFALLMSCAKAPPPPATTFDRSSVPDLRDEMETHFYRALELQLGVLGGDLPAANTAGVKLAGELESGTFPEPWAPFLDETRRAARRAAAATTLSDASAALGALSESCAH